MTSIVDNSRNGVVEIKGKCYILGGAKESSFIHAENREGGRETAFFDGDVADFASKNDHSQLYNSIKKCDNCGKVNAYSMLECNGCGNSIENVELSQSNNVFTGFIHGIARGPFPFKISLRYESEDLIVFDDPLAITRAHVCAIPTDLYIPEMRYLFLNPVLGLEMLNKLSDAAWQATETKFLSNEAWVSQVFSPEGRALDRAILRSHVFAGFNFPPSQYQLHLQHMLPPMTPFHVGMFRAGKHCTFGRYFPIEWVQQALSALVSSNSSIPNATELDSPSLCLKVKELTGVDYDVIHAHTCKRYEQSHELLANYSYGDFKYALPEGDASAPALDLDVLLTSEEELVVEGVTRKDIDDQDKLVLQSYGQPYGANKKPYGVYYSHTKPSPLPTLPVAASESSDTCS